MASAQGLADGADGAIDIENTEHDDTKPERRLPAVLVLTSQQHRDTYHTDDGEIP